MGQVQTSKAELGRVVTDYFDNLFQTSNPEDIQRVTNYVDCRVTEEMNNDLLRDVHPEEVQQALFQMHPLKAPSLDGMNALIFQKFWHIVGGDVT
jgi:hypothetical protein